MSYLKVHNGFRQKNNHSFIEKRVVTYYSITDDFLDLRLIVLHLFDE